ncbi:hypothetical protein ARMSODRAFT_1028359 [Armillaria solidipes]|uniref:Retrotransposon gag domain-containing protein n=1 Tax=Armillaria solidipes TaxID=1076256 RepID=A0A2H3AWZ5_9AGAR|nr:hypothetical protein ARMSODRAFT_1028359 [Armillaria solidipes]
MSHLASSLLGIDPQAQMDLPRASTLSAHPFIEPCLSPITLGSTLSPTPKSLVPSRHLSLAPSPQHVLGTSPTESQEESHPPPRTPTPPMDLDEVIWRYLMGRVLVPHLLLRNASINNLFHHFTSSLLEDPTWLLTTAGQDYMYFTNERKISVGYILREEVAVHATSTWNRVHPWDEQIPIPPRYQPIQVDSPKPMMLTPDISPQYAEMLEYPLRPSTHRGEPVRSHPMGGRYAGGADPKGDRGGYADPVQPPDPADPKLQSLPRGPGAPMPPNLPNLWVVAAANVNLWNVLKPKIIREPAPFKGESADVRRFFNQCEMYFELHQHWLTSSPHHQRQYYSDTVGHWRYPLYADFKKAVHDRFFLDADTRLKYQALKKIRQTDYKSGNIFFQKFEELALEANIIDNEGQMAKIVEEAIRKTARDTIYAQSNHPLDTYEEWKH